MIIKRTKSNPYKIEKVRLFPGNNEITQEQYESIKDKERFKEQVQDGLLVVVKMAAEEGGETSEVHKMNKEAAIKVIKETLDIKALEKFKENEIEHKNRGSVIITIDKQIAKMTDHRGNEESPEPNGVVSVS